MLVVPLGIIGAVGSAYLTFNDTCPLESLISNSIWEKIEGTPNTFKRLV